MERRKYLKPFGLSSDIIQGLREYINRSNSQSLGREWGHKLVRYRLLYPDREVEADKFDELSGVIDQHGHTRSFLVYFESTTGRKLGVDATDEHILTISAHNAKRSSAVIDAVEGILQVTPLRMHGPHSYTRAPSNSESVLTALRESEDLHGGEAVEVLRHIAMSIPDAERFSYGDIASLFYSYGVPMGPIPQLLQNMVDSGALVLEAAEVRMNEPFPVYFMPKNLKIRYAAEIEQRRLAANTAPDSMREPLPNPEAATATPQEYEDVAARQVAALGETNPSEVAPVSDRRFRVGLSFPGEQRPIVEEIAKLLAASLTEERVFYDDFHKAELARPDLDALLQDIYRSQCDLVVVVVCSDYERKEWCKLEWRAIRDIMKQLGGCQIMPIRADDAEVPGLFSIDGYIDIRKHSVLDLVQLIHARLRLLDQSVDQS